MNKGEEQGRRLRKWAHQLERRAQGCAATRVGDVRANALCAPLHFAPPFCVRMGEGTRATGVDASKKGAANVVCASLFACPVCARRGGGRALFVPLLDALFTRYFRVFEFFI